MFISRADKLLLKKMDEFNALLEEMTAAGRKNKVAEQTLSDCIDVLAVEEGLLETLRVNLQSTEENSSVLEKEIQESIVKINAEGREILESGCLKRTNCSLQDSSRFSSMIKHMS